MRYELQLVGTTSAEKVFVVPPSKSTTIRSKLGKLIDYYFAFAGPAAPSPLDGAISGYRNITGAAHLYGRWAYGFWQCKEHYKSQAELLAAAARFREERIPLDAIVQDWLYWGSLGWLSSLSRSSPPDPALRTSPNLPVGGVRSGIRPRTPTRRRWWRSCARLTT